MNVTLEPIKVLVADDQTLFRTSLAHMLNSDPRLRVVAQARDGVDAVEQTIATHPDVVLMDVNMPRRDGVEATRLLSGQAPEVDVLLLSAFTDQRTVSAGLASGAKGFLQKDITVQDVVARILDVRSARGTTHEALDGDLSNRELNVLKQVAAGLSNKQIARRLGISEKTVRNHLSKVFGKLGARNRTEAVMNAMHAGIFIF